MGTAELIPGEQKENENVSPKIILFFVLGNIFPILFLFLILTITLILFLFLILKMLVSTSPQQSLHLFCNEIGCKSGSYAVKEVHESRIASYVDAQLIFFYSI